MWNLQNSNRNKPAWSSSRKRSAPLDGAITAEWDARTKKRNGNVGESELFEDGQQG